MRLLKAMREAERFSPTEQSVIDYMLKNPTEIASLSIRELAELIAESEGEKRRSILIS